MFTSRLKSAKKLGNSSKKKYVTEDTETKKVVRGKILDFKIDDIRIEVSQVDELRIIIHEIIGEEYKMFEGFQVFAIIEKRPPA